ncbi:hypothetical protein VTO42DRAFT_8388 [Malbranchea cinnamomea]
MSQQRDLFSYFKQRTTASNNGVTLTSSQLDGLVSSSSSLSSCPPSSQFASPIAPKGTLRRSHDRPRGTIQSDADNGTYDAPGQTNPATTTTSSFSTSSFGSSSQRVMKNGEVMVTNSDSDTGSESSIESPEELLARFASQLNPEPAEVAQDMPLREASSAGARKQPISTEIPKYTFSIEDLVVHAVDDNETQTNVRKAREEMELRAASSLNKESLDKHSRAKHDDVFASVIEDNSDGTAIQRLKDAIDRTEAFDEPKIWSFFEDTPCPPSPLRFPQKSIAPGFWGGVLRDSSSRERAFFSGIVGEFFDDEGLPDELILWILHAVPLEPRDELRYAYCSSLNLIPAERLSKIINPSHIDQLFRRIGAKSSALVTHEIVQPTYASLARHESRDYRRLLSVLDIVNGISNKLNYLTREHLLKILLRLVLDEQCMSDCSVCVATQNAIISLLRESDDPLTDLSLYEVSVCLYKTVKEFTLQNQLLKQILPVSPRIALFRTRLALAFLYQDPSPLDTPREHLINLKRIRSQLHDSRFNVTRKCDGDPNSRFDYFSFAALTSILNIAIDSGTSMDPATLTSSEEAEDNFNREVDRLADRVKAIFTSIQDSGASHLKRTEAKESLQALHYRLIFGVRTKARPKKSFFEFVKESETILAHFPRTDDQG